MIALVSIKLWMPACELMVLYIVKELQHNLEAVAHPRQDNAHDKNTEIYKRVAVHM